MFPLIKDEYKSMLQALNSSEWSLTDCLRESDRGGQGHFSPVTFGDYRVLDGQKIPKEPVLISDKCDQCTAMCLDYIFELKKKTEKSKVSV